MRIKMRVMRPPRPLRKLPLPIRVRIRANRPGIRVVEACITQMLIVLNIWRVPKIIGGGVLDMLQGSYKFSYNLAKIAFKKHA